MDYRDILTLITALSGSPESPPALQPVAQNVVYKPCPRPLPVYDVEGKTLMCKTVFVPEDRTKPDGRKVGLEFAVLNVKLHPTMTPSGKCSDRLFLTDYRPIYWGLCWARNVAPPQTAIAE